jgi:hypothetical protein
VASRILCVSSIFEKLWAPGLGILLLRMTDEMIATSFNATAWNLIEAIQENPWLRIRDSPKCESTVSPLCKTSHYTKNEPEGNVKMCILELDGKGFLKTDFLGAENET